MESINYLSIIIAGLMTGGLTCFAVQGGLLTSAIAQIKKNQADNEVNELQIVSTFVITKVATYTVVGAILGAFGSFLSISPTVQAWIQIAIAIYMVGIALHLLNVHPIFRYMLLQPPASLSRLVRKVSKGNDTLTTPVLLGMFTIFIPCGTTLAMEALAISSGHPITGAVTMFLFTLSSSWVFFAFGVAARQLNQRVQTYFYKLTAAVIIVLAVISFNGGLNLLGSPVSFDTLASNIFGESEVLGTNDHTESPTVPADFEKIQRVTIEVTSGGYRTSTRTLKKGVPVELTLKTKNSYSCANAFTIPSLDISKMLPVTGIEKITFTPEKDGQLAFSCSMGMYRGNFNVN